MPTPGASTYSEAAGVKATGQQCVKQEFGEVQRREAGDCLQKRRDSSDSYKAQRCNERNDDYRHDSSSCESSQQCHGHYSSYRRSSGSCESSHGRCYLSITVLAAIQMVTKTINTWIAIGKGVVDFCTREVMTAAMNVAQWITLWKTVPS